MSAAASAVCSASATHTHTFTLPQLSREHSCQGCQSAHAHAVEKAGCVSLGACTRTHVRAWKSACGLLKVVNAVAGPLRGGGSRKVSSPLSSPAVSTGAFHLCSSLGAHTDIGWCRVSQSLHTGRLLSTEAPMA